VAIDMARTQGKEKKNLFGWWENQVCHSSIVTTLTCVIKEKKTLR
jgi:hypothetical protein